MNNIINKFWKLLFMFFMFSLSVQAEDVLMIHFKTDGQMVFELEKKPVITFEGDNMFVKYGTTNFSINIGDVTDCYFTANNFILEQHQKETTKPIITKDHVVFSKLPIGSCVYVYTIDGRLFCSYTVNNSGSVDVDITVFPKGIYILKSPLANIKISNR